jgi:hypothetical protein
MRLAVEPTRVGERIFVDCVPSRVRQEGNDLNKLPPDKNLELKSWVFELCARESAGAPRFPC